MTAYWIDTDPGLDDALAILLALSEAAEQVVGFSTLRGNVDEPVAARNLAGLLAEFQLRGLGSGTTEFQVARGAQQPLIGGGSERSASAGRSELGSLNWPTPQDWERADEAPAALALARAARQIADLHLVCLGPLTNLALAVHLDPELPARLAGLTIMGGSLRAGGNVTPAAEFNFARDPEAAQLVLAAGFSEIRLVPLDGCRDLRLMPPDLERLRTLTTAASGLASELIAGWEPRIQRSRGVALYDAVAWLLTTHPELGRWEEVHLTVDTANGAARGASLANWLAVGRHQPNVRAATQVDRGALIEAFFTALA